MTMTSRMLMLALVWVSAALAAPEGYVCPPGVSVADVEAILTERVGTVFGTATNTASPWAEVMQNRDGTISAIFFDSATVWVPATNMTPAKAATARAQLAAAQAATVTTVSTGAEYAGRVTTAKWLEAPTSTGRMAAIAPSDDLTDVVVAPASCSPHYSDADIAAALSAERTARAAIITALNLTPAQIAEVQWYRTCGDREALTTQNKKRYDKIQRALVEALIQLHFRSLR